MSKTYTFDSKKKLKEKIEKISEKKQLQRIKDIIFRCNPEINVSQNSSGMLLFFHNLTDDTYIRIENYISRLDKEKIKQFTDTFTDEEIKLKINDNYITNNSSSNLRLSSVEKNLIKKKIIMKN